MTDDNGPSRFESLVDRLAGTPLRKATTVGTAGAALSLLLFELMPETRQYGLKHNLLYSAQALPVGFAATLIVEYLRQGAKSAAESMSRAYQRYRSR